MPPTVTLSAYKECLPKPNVSFWEWVTRAAALTALLIPISTLFFYKKSSVELFYTIYLLVVLTIMGVYIFIRERKKHHRYAQTTICTHYINHALRDFLEVYKANRNTDDLNNFLSEVLNGISLSFTLIVGRHCRSCIKELKDNMEIKTIARDTLSKGMGDNRPAKKKHMLEANSDFNDLWYSQNGCTRYFFSNNLKSLWAQHKYKNSSFDELGYPTGKYIIRNWRLPYKSSIVFPIRFLSDKAISSGGDEEPDDQAKYWGFLCIDCLSTNVFDPIYSVELGGAFADALFAFFSQLDYIKTHLSLTVQKSDNNVSESQS